MRVCVCVHVCSCVCVHVWACVCACVCTEIDIFRSAKHVTIKFVYLMRCAQTSYHYMCT